MRTAILMAASNEQVAIVRTLGAIRDRAAALGGVSVVVVDDGSQPKLRPAVFPMPGDHLRMVVVRHAVNLARRSKTWNAPSGRRRAPTIRDRRPSTARGLTRLRSRAGEDRSTSPTGAPGPGAALETTRRLALGETTFDVFVTTDADGQHRVDDLVALVSAVGQGADIALGSRFLESSSEIPRLRPCLLVGARLLEMALNGSRLTDARHGFRAISRRVVAQTVLRQRSMAHATEITLHVHRLTNIGLRVVEVPVCIEYSEHTLRNGQRTTGAIPILRDLLHRFLSEEG